MKPLFADFQTKPVYLYPNDVIFAPLIVWIVVLLGFDAVLQFRDRISSYVANGHPLDKIEVLVLGGTWSEYPEGYQREFVRDLFYAANTTYNERPDRLTLAEEIKINEVR